MNETMKQWFYDHRKEIFLLLAHGALCYFWGYANGATSIKSVISGLNGMQVLVNVTDQEFIDAFSKHIK